ncbi:MAG TPA: hypothetical protein RMH99_21115 [Sandaracinaceae bacterium LLY-WYZ-13_1]|nr:hypothetical protein [Sandaracinaceae bacterium LLY-WYZ-13_1]
MSPPRMSPSWWLVMALVLAWPAAARGQERADGFAHLRAALIEHAAQAVADREGRLFVRVRAQLPDGAPRPRALVVDLVRPTVDALTREPRFERVHLGVFAGEGAEAAARARRLGYDALLDLELHLVGGDLRVEALAWGTPPSDDGAPATPARFELAQALDVALRRYVGFPPRVSAETVVARAARMPSRGYLALAVHDLDRDGRTEIVAVHPDGAQVLRLGAARVGVRLEEVGRAPWPDLPRDPSPPPRALATAMAHGDAVVTRLGDHAAASRVRLVGTRVVVDRAPGPCPDDRFPTTGGCAQIVNGRDFFDEVLIRPGAEDGDLEAAAHFYSFAGRALPTRGGDETWYEALVTPHGRLSMHVRHTSRPDEGEPTVHERSVGAVGYGTALAMTDLDVDGTAELLTSHAAPAGAGDQLSLLRAHPRGALHVVWRSEAMEGSVWVAAAGDVDGDGLDELVAIEEPADPSRGRARLWIVR